MIWGLIAVAGWVVITALVGLLAWSLARAAAVGDQDQPEQLAWARAVEADEFRGHVGERRVSPEERRAVERPWAGKAPGRRAEDALREDLAEAHLALRDAEERLGEIEARRSA